MLRLRTTCCQRHYVRTTNTPTDILMNRTLHYHDEWRVFIDRVVRPMAGTMCNLFRNDFPRTTFGTDLHEYLRLSCHKLPARACLGPMNCDLEPRQIYKGLMLTAISGIAMFAEVVPERSRGDCSTVARFLSSSTLACYSGIWN